MKRYQPKAAIKKIIRLIRSAIKTILKSEFAKQIKDERAFSGSVMYFFALIFVIVLLMAINWPFNSTDVYSIGGQLLVSVFFAAIGIWISDQKKWVAFKKATLFGITTAFAFLIWNLIGPLQPIQCSTDVILFKDGSGALLAPQVYADFDSTDLHFERDGYDEISAMDQYSNEKVKGSSDYNLKLLAASTLSWISEAHLDWSGCTAERMFTGLSSASEYINCNEKSSSKSVNATDLFVGIGGHIASIYLPPNTKIKAETGSNLLLKLVNPSIEATFLFSEILPGEKLKPHIEGTKPRGIEENIARYYKARPMPLSNHWLRVNFSLTTNKFHRWSKDSEDFQTWAHMFCNEYEKAFSWYVLKEKLNAAFSHDI